MIYSNRKFPTFPTSNQTRPAMGIARNQDIVELSVALELKALGLRVEIVLFWPKNRRVRVLHHCDLLEIVAVMGSRVIDHSRD